MAYNNVNSLLEHASGKTVIHKMNPTFKLFITFFYIIAVLSVNQYHFNVLCFYIIYPALVIPLCEIQFSILFKRTIIPLVFSLFAGIPNVFYDTRIFAYLFSFEITYGIISLITLIIKTFLCVVAVLLFTATTPNILLTLKKLKVPKLFVMILFLIYRYLFLIAGEAKNMSTAYLLRSPKSKGIQMKDMGVFAGQLLIRSYDKSERVFQSMLMRGFHD